MYNNCLAEEINMDMKTFIAIWGATLSTLLALVKLIEIWISRRRIETSYGFSSPQIGNKIIIRNISDKPFIITYWNLLFCEKKKLQWVPYNSIEPSEDTHDICVTGHSTKVLYFKEQNYFDWGNNVMAGKRIYLELSIAGKRRSIKRLIYKA